jgi:hypothetical protein
MNVFEHHGSLAAIEKFGGYKPVAPKAPATPKPAHTTGTKLPTLPKAPVGPAGELPKPPGMPGAPDTSTGKDTARPDALMAAELVGGPVQNAHAIAQTVAQNQGIKAAMFRFGLLPDPKPLEGEIRPDNGQTFAAVSRNEGYDRMSLIDQSFRSVSDNNAANSQTDDALKVL